VFRPVTVDVMEMQPADSAPAARTCDISTMCLNCGTEMQPEHAHYRCRACGWRDSCCD
jgi:hypothetical protein